MRDYRKPDARDRIIYCGQHSGSFGFVDSRDAIRCTAELWIPYGLRSLQKATQQAENDSCTSEGDIIVTVVYA